MISYAGFITQFSFLETIFNKVDLFLPIIYLSQQHTSKKNATVVQEKEAMTM